MPTMTHPQSDQHLEVGHDQVALYESQGWSVQTAPARKTSAPKKKAEPDTATTATDEGVAHD